MTQDSDNKRLQALKVHQWLPAWSDLKFSAHEHRAKPQPYFFIFSMSARELRSLSGISRRQASVVSSRAGELGIQREHDADRSKEIERFIEFGFPWSTISEAKRRTEEFNDLRKPGWLPTAIVTNILRSNDERYGHKVATADLVHVDEQANATEIILPYRKWTPKWEPTEVPPIEVIDGQHRLWAFEKESKLPEFEVPVVAFYGLDISWQAYLFYTINIKPKRINQSLAYDLYPLLRTEDWLDKAEGHQVYRETRSQELVEALWSHQASPWYDRINMLGEKGNRSVSQSAWIKSLMATLVRPWEGKGDKIGGLFGSRLSEKGEVLRWSRAQQAAFLIFAWQQLRTSIKKTNAKWAKDVRSSAEKDKDLQADQDAAFYGSQTLLMTDQGVRGYLHVLNDLCFLAAAKFKLNDWQLDKDAAASDDLAVAAALKSFAKLDVARFIGEIAAALSFFDWRTSAAFGLNPDEQRTKLAYRGSSGYRVLRKDLLHHLGVQGGDLGKYARSLV